MNWEGAIEEMLGTDACKSWKADDFADLLQECAELEAKVNKDLSELLSRNKRDFSPSVRDLSPYSSRTNSLSNECETVLELDFSHKHSNSVIIKSVMNSYSGLLKNLEPVASSTESNFCSKETKISSEECDYKESYMDESVELVSELSYNYEDRDSKKSTILLQSEYKMLCTPDVSKLRDDHCLSTAKNSILNSDIKGSFLSSFVEIEEEKEERYSTIYTNLSSDSESSKPSTIHRAEKVERKIKVVKTEPVERFSEDSKRAGNITTSIYTHGSQDENLDVVDSKPHFVFEKSIQSSSVIGSSINTQPLKAFCTICKTTVMTNPTLHMRKLSL
jgi:hypothetical protein